VNVAPGVTDAPSPVLAVDRSALVATPGESEEEVLLEGSGSAVVEPTLAVFEMIVPAWTSGATCTLSVIGVVCPDVSVPRLQVTVCPPVVQVGVLETKVNGAGNVSVTTTFSAGDGPALCTVSV
jgi:hypothetical protein